MPTSFICIDKHGIIFYYNIEVVFLFFFKLFSFVELQKNLLCVNTNHSFIFCVLQTKAQGDGVCSGAIGGSGANGTNLRGVVKTSKQVLKTATSPKKDAMYTAKISTVRKKLQLLPLVQLLPGLHQMDLIFLVDYYRKQFKKVGDE